jgi:hypothetical protein
MISSRCLTFAAVLFCSGLVSGCAPQANPPPVAAAPVVVTPSSAMLRAEWLKGYDAGFANGERLQSRADAEVTAQATMPPPPHVKKPAPPAVAAAPPATRPPAPVASAPPQSVFIPIGPAEPLNAAQ